MDAANVDLKGFTPEFYKFLTLSKLEPVLETLRWLKHESNVWFEITNLMIPGENDSAEETSRMCDWIVENLGPDVPVHFTAFHPDFRMLDYAHTPAATLLRARKQALSAGIRFPYVGNVHDVVGQSTYCPSCEAVLIERDWYQLGHSGLRGNRCIQCGETIPGVFEDRPGNWGAKRQPIRISEPQPVVLSLAATRAPDSFLETDAKTAMASSPLSRLASILTGATDPAVAPQPVPPSPAPTEGGVAETATKTSPRIDFTAEEADQIAGHARAVAHAVLHHQPIPDLAGPLADTPAYGMFVTFRHGDKLRACKGQFGQLSPLGVMLNQVSQDSATNDPRFAPVRADELPQLSVEVSLMFNPQTLQAKGDVRAQSLQVGQHGLVIQHPRGRGLLLPQVATEHGWDALTFLQGLCRKAKLPADAWKSDDAQLMTFQARLFDSPPAAATPIIRPPARAGQFYSADATEMQQQVDHFLSTETHPASAVRAVMLPHAGWIYCGDVMGQTLARVTVPRTVILVGPKHTALGAKWSVSNADAWDIPGARIPVATDLRARLLELVPALAVEAAAHSEEHAIEVILPFLRTRNPDVRILPLVLGPTSYSQTEQFAQALAILCRESPEPLLLVISSDMHHFAAEAENRRLDFLAIDAMRTGNAGELFDVTQRHRITMCGVIPAITILRALEFSRTPPHPELVQYDNSGTASGQLDRVVGYAGMTIP